MQSEFNQALSDTLYRVGVVPVLTIENAETGVALARALARGGLDLIEVTLRTPAALEASRRIRTEVPLARVGAGTVLDAETALVSTWTFAPWSVGAKEGDAGLGARTLAFVVTKAAMGLVTAPWQLFALRALLGVFAGYGSLTVSMAAESVPMVTNGARSPVRTSSSLIM